VIRDFTTDPTGQISPAGPLAMRSLPCETGTKVTARGLEQLVKDLPNLKELWLSDQVVTEAEKGALRQASPGLKIR
jgi:hypothetical protein